MTTTVKQIPAQSLPDCPFCGGTLAVAVDEGQPVALIHSSPACEEVRTLDPATFIMKARRKANPEWPSAFHDHLDQCDTCTDEGGWCLAGLALLGGKQ